ncbi:hypothetical protein ACJX0J_015488, partial [Zea mays]
VSAASLSNFSTAGCVQELFQMLLIQQLHVCTVELIHLDHFAIVAYILNFYQFPSLHHTPEEIYLFVNLNFCKLIILVHVFKELYSASNYNSYYRTRGYGTAKIFFIIFVSFIIKSMPPCLSILNITMAKKRRGSIFTTFIQGPCTTTFFASLEPRVEVFVCCICVSNVKNTLLCVWKRSAVDRSLHRFNAMQICTEKTSIINGFHIFFPRGGGGGGGGGAQIPTSINVSQIAIQREGEGLDKITTIYGIILHQNVL